MSRWSVTESTTLRALVEANVASLWIGNRRCSGERGRDLDRKRSLEISRHFATCSTLSGSSCRICSTLVVDSIGVGIGVSWLPKSLLAAFIHVTSELAFILNSTRLFAPWC